MFEILQQIDGNILLFIQEYIRRDWMDGFWEMITHLGDGGIFWIILALLLLIPRKTRGAGLSALLAMGVGALITNVAIKNIVARVRPYDTISELILLIERQHDYSFPSGHTCASFAAAYALYRTLPRKWGIPCLVLATLIALSRLYVGVHYPSDVLGGLAVGIFAGWAGWKLKEKLTASIVRRKKEQEETNEDTDRDRFI